MRCLICLSLTREDAARLQTHGPRRDIVLLAERLGASVLYRKPGAQKRTGIRGKLFGPQLAHAWRAARLARKYDVVFADGEHVGLPLALFAALRFDRSRPLVVLGHLVDKPWKRRLLWLASRLTTRGLLILHSVRQEESVRDLLGPGWRTMVLPYQVDTAYWNPDGATPEQPPMILAAGSENRDYGTLAAAAQGLEARVVIAAGSHWARTKATVSSDHPNVEYLDRTLPFAELRELYGRASVVVVPLNAGNNQSGVTGILEAMAMGKPVVVTATEGQREVLTGPLIGATGEDPSTEDRGPRLFGLAQPGEPDGYYVPVSDSAALHTALASLLSSPETCERLGRAGRRSALANFTVEAFAERFAEAIRAFQVSPATGRE